VLPARSRRRMPMVMPTTVHIRRSYAENRYGQLHMTTAYPSGGGFDERVPLVCLHPAGSSSHYFGALLPELGRDRSVYAFDLPGFGRSDAPQGEFVLTEIAAALLEFVESLRLRQVDIMGLQLGALIAVEMANQKPQQVRRLALGSVPHFTAAEMRSPEWTTMPALPLDDGSHLLKDWQRLQQSRGGYVSADQLTEELADLLHSRRRCARVQHAMLEYPTAKQLAGLRQSVLLLRPRDEFYEHTLRAKHSCPQSFLEELPDSGSNIFAHNAAHVLQALRQYFDR